MYINLNTSCSKKKVLTPHNFMPIIFNTKFSIFTVVAIDPFIPLGCCCCEGPAASSGASENRPQHEHGLFVHLHHAFLLLALWTCWADLRHTGTD